MNHSLTLAVCVVVVKRDSSIYMKITIPVSLVQLTFNFVYNPIPSTVVGDHHYGDKIQARVDLGHWEVRIKIKIQHSNYI